ncbi:MAG: hypothetical protein KDB56_14760, partial [Mycobacterium sp.]|nr:hypothetical protein [Mycobacterium sp.]
GGDLGETVGAQVATAVMNLVTDPVVGAALVGLVDTVATDFFGATGVVSALADAAGEAAADAVAGQDLATVLTAVVAALRANPDVEAAVEMTVSRAVTEFLADQPLVNAVVSTVTTLTEQLAGDTPVQVAVGQVVATLVASLLPGNPGAAQIGAVVGDAVVGILAEAPLVDGVVDVVTTTVATLLGQPGVPAALGDAAGQIADAILSGATVSAALQEAVQALGADPAMLSALSTTVDAALDVVDTALLSNPDVQLLLGSTVTTVIEQLAAIPGARTAIGDLLGPSFGPAVVGLLADSTFVDDVAVTLGAVIVDLLAFPGFNGAVTGAIGKMADAVLDGTDISAAIQEGLAALEANPDYRAAVGTIVPSALNSLLSNPEVRQAVATTAKTIVIDLLRGGLLGNGIFSNDVIDGAVGQVVGVTVDSFLAKPNAKILLDGIAVNVLEGMPLDEVANTVIQAVLRDPMLQVALGTSVGQGIGSLFGDNIVGLLVGGVAGITATVVIGIASGLTLLFTGGGPVIGAAATTGGQLAEGHFLETVTVAGDLYVMTAVIPDSQFAAVLGEAAATEGGLVLTEMTVTGPDESRAEALDIQMAIGAAGHTDAGQLRVGFTFDVEQLLAVPAPARSFRAEGTPAERVG